MNKELHSRINSICAEVLNIEAEVLETELRSQLPSWDSLKHMELILRLEEEFQIRLSSREVAEIHSLEDLVQIIASKP